MGDLLKFPINEDCDDNILLDEIKKKSDIDAAYIVDIITGKEESSPLANRYRSNLYSEFLKELDEIEKKNRPEK